MLIRLDPAVTTPLYEQLAASIRRGIAQGEILPGERLPGARDLAASLNVNVHTVLRGYGLLREEGLMDLRRGRGAVITGTADTQVAQDRAALTEAVAQIQLLARRHGLTTADLSTLVTQGYS